MDRDQGRTPFTPILEAVVAASAGACAAALVDRDGETVDYAGSLRPYFVKLAAAHLSILASQLEQARLLAPSRAGGAAPAFSVVLSALRVSMRTATMTLSWEGLPDGYRLIVLGGPAGAALSLQALAAEKRALCREAGWSHLPFPMPSVTRPPQK